MGAIPLTRPSIPSAAGMAVMAVLCLTPLLGLWWAGIAVPLGIALFLVDRAMGHRLVMGSGEHLRAYGALLRRPRLWLWIAPPALVYVAALVAANGLIPDYVDAAWDSIGSLRSPALVAKVLFELSLLALGEEIAWRGFFQQQLRRLMSPLPAITLSALLPALGRISAAPAGVVVYDMAVTALCALLFGLIFERTRNIWVSTTARFLTSVAGMLTLLFL